MTAVTGRPPIKPEIILPKPCAFNSRLVGVILFCGSSLSPASVLSKLSRLAMIAMVTASIYTFGCKSPAKSGNVNCCANCPIEFATGSFTSCVSTNCKAGLYTAMNSLMPVPTITATRAPGIHLLMAKFLINGKSQIKIMPMDSVEITIDMIL